LLAYQEIGSLNIGNREQGMGIGTQVLYPRQFRKGHRYTEKASVSMDLAIGGGGGDEEDKIYPPPGSCLVCQLAL
jgi:hypothetical protein